jgi:hypothetical protein
MSEKLKNQIYQAIRDSSELREGNYISVNIKGTGLLGLGKKQIELRGRAANEKDKAKIEEIAKGIAGDLEIVSTIRLDRTTK